MEITAANVNQSCHLFHMSSSNLPANPGFPEREDEDLTCLNWLHENTDLLQELRFGGQDPLPNLPPSTPKLAPSRGSSRPALPLAALEPRTKSNAAKPPYSFSSLIFMAIEGSPNKCLPVKDIYDWILATFPYFQQAPVGWKNSVRHNLSLSKCFTKLKKDKCKNMGKGSLWTVDPEYRPALIEALNKTNSLCMGTTPVSFSTETSPTFETVYEAESRDFQEPRTDVSSEIISTDTGHPWELSPLNSDHGEDHTYTIYKMAASIAAGDMTSLSEGVFHVDMNSFVTEGEVLDELGANEYCEMEEGDDCPKDPLADSGYIEYHEYFILEAESDNGLDLRVETVEVLELDEEVHAAAGSLLNLARVNY
ncbi:forkhead box protein N2 [Polypterus senegalus]